MGTFTEFGLNKNESSGNREALNKHSDGRKKYLTKIDKGSKEADKKNLPFTFSKPKKSASLNVPCWCEKCGTGTRVTKSTVMVICKSCGELYSVTKENSEV